MILGLLQFYTYNRCAIRWWSTCHLSDAMMLCAQISELWLCELHRFMRYDPLRNSTEVLLENLYFANGVQLSRYDDFVLVVETSRARIIKCV